MIRGFIHPFLSTVAGLFGGSGSQQKDSMAVLPSTQVADAQRVEMRQETARIDTKPERIKHFRRNTEELRLGLSIEEAAARRRGEHVEKSAAESAHVPERGADKAKRFRRTAEEIALGLTPEQAAQRRGVELPQREARPVGAKNVIERKAPQPTGAGSLDLFKTLPAKTQRRASALMSWRRNGGKGVVTASDLDLIEQAVAAGKVTRCPTGIDSDGWDHFNQREVK